MSYRNSKAKQDATQRRATDSNGGKSREASLVLELHRASTCYSRAEQQIQWQAMDEAGQIGGRKGKEKKSCEDKRTEGGERALVELRNLPRVQVQCAVVQCSAV